MIEILLANIYIQSSIIGLILAAVYFKLSRRDKLNEPPLAYYRFPIIGHTWSFLMDVEKLILESREKYGETFSLYVFGQIITIVGKETTHEILKNDQEFNRDDAIESQVPISHIFNNINIEKNTKIVGEYVLGKVKYLVDRLQKDIIKAIDLYIGECIEPKVVHDPRKSVTNIIAFPVANIIVDECGNYEDILEAFKSLTFSVFNLLYIPPILSFIHPWLHQQFVTIPLRFGWNPVSKHKNIIISRIKPITEKRLYDKKRLGDAWVAPLDGLQNYLNDPEVAPDLDPNNVNYNFIVDAICSFIFAAMGPTVDNSIHALYDLVGRKQYWHELYQEAQEINKQCNGNELTSDDIAKMVKLDSFVKESIRLSASNYILGFARKCTSKSHFTFANGHQIPNGRIIFSNIIDTHNDDQEFYAYRHLERNSPATKIERNFLAFGGGKHPCPGRFYATNEIKVFLHNIILKYNIRAETEEIGSETKYTGPFSKKAEGGIVFENRKEIIN